VPARGYGSRDLPGTQFGSADFRCFNTGKTSRILDISSDTGQAEFAQLFSDANALVCNLAPLALCASWGWMAKPCARDART